MHAGLFIFSLADSDDNSLLTGHRRVHPYYVKEMSELRAFPSVWYSRLMKMGLGITKRHQSGEAEELPGGPSLGTLELEGQFSENRGIFAM